jgi:hypothetical protein
VKGAGDVFFLSPDDITARSGSTIFAIEAWFAAAMLRFAFTDCRYPRIAVWT